MYNTTIWFMISKREERLYEQKKNRNKFLRKKVKILFEGFPNAKTSGSGLYY